MWFLFNDCRHEKLLIKAVRVCPLVEGHGLPQTVLHNSLKIGIDVDEFLAHFQI